MRPWMLRELEDGSRSNPTGKVLVHGDAQGGSWFRHQSLMLATGRTIRHYSTGNSDSYTFSPIKRLDVQVPRAHLCIPFPAQKRNALLCCLSSRYAMMEFKQYPKYEPTIDLEGDPGSQALSQLTFLVSRN